MNIWVVDIDGTVADTRERIDAIVKKYGVSEGEWHKELTEEFLNDEALKQDKIIEGCEIVAKAARACKAKMFFLTGREEMGREKTRMWLKYHLNIFDSVPLIMRPDKNYGNPAELKEKMFKNTIFKQHPEATFVFFDDDIELLERYSKYGLALKAPECWGIIKYVDKII